MIYDIEITEITPAEKRRRAAKFARIALEATPAADVRAESWRAVEVARRYADGEATRGELLAAARAAWIPPTADLRSFANGAAWGACLADPDEALDEAGNMAHYAAFSAAAKAVRAASEPKLAIARAQRKAALDRGDGPAADRALETYQALAREENDDAWRAAKRAEGRVAVMASAD